VLVLQPWNWDVFGKPNYYFIIIADGSFYIPMQEKKEIVTGVQSSFLIITGRRKAYSNIQCLVRHTDALLTGPSEAINGAVLYE
jgi:hypothetical protein